jgi:hypothetical protein
VRFACAWRACQCAPRRLSRRVQDLSLSCGVGRPGPAKAATTAALPQGLDRFCLRWGPGPGTESGDGPGYSTPA